MRVVAQFLHNLPRLPVPLACYLSYLLYVWCPAAQHICKT